MVEFSTPAWIALALVAGIGVLAILNSAASIIRNQTYVHDTKVQVNSLRKDYVDRTNSQPDVEEIDDGEILIVDEAQPAPSHAPHTPPTRRAA